MKKILYRVKQPTPPFFKRLRKISLLLMVCAFAILTVPVAIPPLLVTMASYLLVAGCAAGTVCQLTVDTEREFLRWINGVSNEYLPRFIDRQLLK